MSTILNFKYPFHSGAAPVIAVELKLGIFMVDAILRPHLKVLNKFKTGRNPCLAYKSSLTFLPPPLRRDYQINK